MKIVYISNSIIPSTLANSIQVMKMCEAFTKLGHKVILIARRPKEKINLTNNIYEYYGIKNIFPILFLPWPIPKLGGFIYSLFCIQNLFKSDIDIIYTRSIYGALSALICKLPYIYEAHCPPHNQIHYLLQKVLFKSTFFKHLVVISNALKQEYERLYPCLRYKRIIVAHDGADPPNEQDENSKFLTKWPGRPGVLQVGYIGNLYPGKGVEVIIKLANLLPDMDFHIIGGTEKDVYYWKKRFNYPNLFFHGFIPPSQTQKYRAACDILLLPAQYKVATDSKGKGDISRWMSPLKLFEYMASRRAIIASNLPTISEVLQNEYNALLVKPDSIDEWIQSLQRLSKDKLLREKLANNAFRDLINKYTWYNRARNVL